MSKSITQSELKNLACQSPLEAKLAAALDVEQIKYQREFLFALPRKWPADFAIPSKRGVVLVEVEGGQWSAGGKARCKLCGQSQAGRHARGKGYQTDCEKYNAAVALGYRVLRFTTTHITRQMDSYVIPTIREVLG